MKSHHRSLRIAIILVLLATPQLNAQRPISNAPAGAGARLELTTTSEEARTAFRNAWFESQNLNPAAARAQVAIAAAADPQFGLARAYQAFLATGTPADRERAIGTAIAEMRGATATELLLALFWRETAAARPAVAIQLLDILAPLVPGDPELAYMHFTAHNTGSAAERAEGFRRFLQRFPQHAAAHNNGSYVFWVSGDPSAALAAAEEYMRLVPQHHNAHDTYADILLLLRRPQDAIAHAQRELELTPGLPAGIMKHGTIQLMLNDPAAARTHFATGRDAATTFAARLPFQIWLAVSHLYSNEARIAVQQLEQIATDARTANVPATVATAHEWAAVIDAYSGNTSAIAAHLAAAAAAVPTPVPFHHIARAIAFGQAGNTEQAAAALAQLTTVAPNNANIPLVTALLALRARDLPAAETALAQAGPANLLAQSLRADLMLRKGQRREALALRDQVLASAIKLDGNPGVDFFKVVARLHAQQLR